MDEIFVLGGTLHGACSNHFSSVYEKLNTKENRWTNIASLNELVINGACAVYQNRIIFCGGIVNGGIPNKVNSYDPFVDEWTPMPNMISGKYDHKCVVVKNKFFVISSDLQDFEVFDNTHKMFVSFFTKLKLFRFNPVNQVVAIGNKFYVFLQRQKNFFLCYDVDEGKWSMKCLSCKIFNFSCVKIRWF